MNKDQKAWQIEWGVGNLVELAPEIEANVSFIVGLPAETERRAGGHAAAHEAAL